MDKASKLGTNLQAARVPSTRVSFERVVPMLCNLHAAANELTLRDVDTIAISVKEIRRTRNGVFEAAAIALRGSAEKRETDLLC